MLRAVYPCRRRAFSGKKPIHVPRDSGVPPESQAETTDKLVLLDAPAEGDGHLSMMHVVQADLKKKKKPKRKDRLLTLEAALRSAKLTEAGRKRRAA